MTPIPILIDPAERRIAAHEALQDYVKSIRNLYGPIPAATLDSWRTAAVPVRVATLAICGLAVFLDDSGNWRRAELSEVSSDVAGATDWRRVAAEWVPFAELQRRRYGGNAA
jgi:hypothetical protein